MKIRALGFIAAAVIFASFFPRFVFASGGIMAITADDFNSRVEGNSYVVEGQGIKVTIENGIVTVTKDNNTVRIDGQIELNGTVLHAGTLDNPTNNTTTVTTSTSATAVTNTNTTVTNPTFTSKFIKRLGF